MDTDQGYYLTVDVAPDGTGRIIIHHDKISMPIYLSDEERRELIARLWHRDDERKTEAILLGIVERAEHNENFKVLEFKGRNKE